MLQDCLQTTFGQGSNSGGVKVRECEPIRTELCRHLGYNVTGMPNLVGHEDQKDAELQLTTFTPLIQYGCSSQLKFFLCSAYFPMCTEKVLDPIGPCRPMCQNVKARCEPVLQMFGFPWPSVLNCSKFPPKNDNNHMCMEGPDADEGPLPPHLPPGVTPPYPYNPIGNPTSTGATGTCAYIKNGHEKYHYNNQSEKVPCALRCEEDDLFNKDDKRFAQIWISLWVVLCFLSTMFTVLTFAIDSQRFHYPERTIVLIALCYNFCCIAYIIRLIAGRDAIACDVDNNSSVPVLISAGLQNTNCTVVFLFLYYFSMASYIWWIILSLTWFLAAGLKWGHEAIQRHSSFFHLAAWGIPAVQSICILVMRVVDADELTGLCYVGNRNSKNLMGFVIAPFLVYLVLGLLLLVGGFIGLFRVKHQLRNDVGQTERLEMLMARVGVFAVIYTLTAACVVGSYLYEYVNLIIWHTPGQTDSPKIEIFMLKIFMSLVVGISTGIWMLSKKTVTSWKAFFAKLFGCQQNDQKKTISQPSSQFPHYPYFQPKQPGTANPVSQGTVSGQYVSLDSSGLKSPPPSLVKADPGPKGRFLDGGEII